MTCILHEISDILIWNEIDDNLFYKVCFPFTAKLAAIRPQILNQNVIDWFANEPDDSGVCYFYAGVYQVDNFHRSKNIRDQLCFKFTSRDTAILFKLTFN